MTKWLISHSSKVRVKWQALSFNGPAGQESSRHRRHDRHPEESSSIRELSVRRGDLFEIILIQVKGGTAKFPPLEEVDRLV